MFFVKALAAPLFAAALVCAQGIEIKGTVKDASGAPLAGVSVKLEKTGYTALTGSDGSFTLNSTASVITLLAAPAAGSARVALSRGKVLRAGEGDVWTTYGIDGKSLPIWDKLPVIPLGGGALPAAAKAAASAGFKDILFAGKAGYLPYRLAITSPSASGLELKLLASAGIIKDGDGNEYQTVKIGNQTWMAEHMRATKYIDGSAIPRIQDKAGWANRATPAMCSYNGMADPDSLKRFGMLYNWHTINTKKLNIEGWHIPSGAEWMALQNHLIANGGNFDGSTSGNKVGKAMAGMTDWATATKAGAVGNDQAKNNKSGFGAAPTGFRDQGGNFTSMGSRCIMHATDTKENTFGYFADIDAASETLRYSDDWMSMGFLVRLVKN